MNEDDDSTAERRSRSLPARFLAAMSPRRHWIGLAMFAAALILGVIASMVWIHGHRAQPTPVAVDTVAPTDPTHPPLPAPMPGGLASMPAEVPTSANAAYIKAEPIVEPAQNRTVAMPNSTTVANGAETSAVPFSPPSSGESGPQLVRRVQPQYPIDALRHQVEGSVQVQISLDATGAILDVGVTQSSRSRSLDSAAVDAVRNWQFHPAVHNGQAVPSTVTESIDFHLADH